MHRPEQRDSVWLRALSPATLQSWDSIRWQEMSRPLVDTLWLLLGNSTRAIRPHWQLPFTGPSTASPNRTLPSMAKWLSESPEQIMSRGALRLTRMNTAGPPPWRSLESSVGASPILIRTHQGSQSQAVSRRTVHQTKPRPPSELSYIDGNDMGELSFVGVDIGIGADDDSSRMRQYRRAFSLRSTCLWAGQWSSIGARRRLARYLHRHDPS